MKLIFAILISIVLLFLSLNLFYTNQQDNNDIHDVHYHAGFQVYIDGELQDYSALKYMHLDPCSLEEESPDYSLVKERVHLHNGIGDVAHIHTNGVRYIDLMESLEIEDVFAEGYISYLNGLGSLDLLYQEISPYDSAIFMIGKAPENFEQVIAGQVTQEEIIESEKMLEACGI